ncbi:hypothetical protein FB446DRAFT_633123, partial [Lentinula raphanica]
LAKVTRHQNHKCHRNCRCMECKKACEDFGCTAPFKCMSKAMELIRILPSKWNPLSTLADDYSGPAEIPKAEDNDSHFFDWHITTHETLADAFRIFTEGVSYEGIPTTAWEPDPTNATPEAYTDGSCTNEAGVTI